MKKILIIAAGILLAFGLIYFINRFEVDNKSIKPSEKPKQEQTSYNFLLLGYGGGTHEGTYLTDTMIIAHIDTKTKKANLISIPRDLWVKLPTKSGTEDFHTKINSVYQMELYSDNYPGLDKKYMGTDEDATLTKTIVKQISGLPIDGYVSVNFEGFTKVIDILGGIDIDVERSFIDEEYPIDGKEKDLCGQEEIFKKAEPFITPPFSDEERTNKFKEDPKIEEFVKNATSSPQLAFPCRYEKLEFTKGITHMDGKTALKYARSRHSPMDGGDFNRGRRQQKVIEAVKDKVLSLGFVPKIIPLMDQFKQDVKTDIGLDIIRKFIGEADNTNQYKAISFVLSDDNVLENAVSSDKQYILIPSEGMDKWTGIRKFIDNSIKGITPTPEASPSAAIDLN